MAAPGPWTEHVWYSATQEGEQGSPGLGGGGRAQPVSQTAARGPVPAASSPSQVTLPGPCATQLENSVAHVDEQSVGGLAGGGGGSTHPASQTPPAKRPTAATRACSQVVKFAGPPELPPSSLPLASDPAPAGLRALMDAVSEQPAVHNGPSGPLLASISWRHAE